MASSSSNTAHIYLSTSQPNYATPNTPHKRPRESDSFVPPPPASAGAGAGGPTSTGRLTASDLLNAITSTSTSTEPAGGPSQVSPSHTTFSFSSAHAPASNPSAGGSFAGAGTAEYYSSSYPVSKVSRTSTSPPPVGGSVGQSLPLTAHSANSGALPHHQPLQQQQEPSSTTASQLQPQPQAHPLLCTLPPTCNRKPTPIASTRDLESHYAKYHAHVCEEKGCGCVFPDARLLELHQTENHDPLAAVRKDRGEKIFACHLITCDRKFATPKARRLHLIEVHKYPKEYFFAVTNKGVGGLLRKWGDGASMIRKEWKPRGGEKGDDDRMVEDDDEQEDEDEGDEDGEEERDVKMDEDKEAPLASGASTTRTATRNDDVKSTIARQQQQRYHQQVRSQTTTGKPNRSNNNRNSEAHRADDNDHSNDNDEGLANAMSSLSLVPTSIRFGRGGKMGGFSNNNHNYGGPGHSHGRGGSNGREPGHARSGSQDKVDDQHFDGAIGGEGHQQQQSLGHDAHGQRGGHSGAGHHPQRGLGWAARSRPGVMHVRGRGRGRGVPV